MVGYLDYSGPSPKVSSLLVHVEHGVNAAEKHMREGKYEENPSLTCVYIAMLSYATLEKSACQMIPSLISGIVPLASV